MAVLAEVQYKVSLCVPRSRARAGVKVYKGLHGLELVTITGHSDFQLYEIPDCGRGLVILHLAAKEIASQISVQFSIVDKIVASFMAW